MHGPSLAEREEIFTPSKCFWTVSGGGSGGRGEKGVVWRGLGGGGGFPTCFFWLLHEHICGVCVGRWEHSGGRCEVGGFGEQGVCTPEKWWVRCICMCWEGGWTVFGAGRAGSLEEAIGMYASLTYTQVCLHMLRAHTCPIAQHESLRDSIFPEEILLWGSGIIRLLGSLPEKGWEVL